VVPFPCRKRQKALAGCVKQSEKPLKLPGVMGHPALGEESEECCQEGATARRQRSFAEGKLWHFPPCSVPATQEKHKVKGSSSGPWHCPSLQQMGGCCSSTAPGPRRRQSLSTFC